MGTYNHGKLSIIFLVFFSFFFKPNQKGLVRILLHVNISLGKNTFFYIILTRRKKITVSTALGNGVLWLCSFVVNDEPEDVNFVLNHL